MSGGETVVANRWQRAAAVAVAMASLALGSDAGEARTVPGEPRLVLAIVVDQFRHEYLNRWGAEFDGGLARLIADGAVLTDAHLEHYPTVTGVGHATLLTGALPSASGIIGNDWFDRERGHNVNCVWDPGVALLGAPGPGASPHRLLASSVADELKLTRGPGPKVIGISRKDRAAILTPGRSADAAYWVDGDTGRFVSSTWYFESLPAWVEEFNARDMAGSFAGREWRALDDEARLLATIPTAPRPAVVDAVGKSPFSNDMLVALAREAIAHERLGQRGATDVLTVSFSANDSVGHAHGPESAQVRDITLRTDRQIGELLTAVDEAVGLERTLVVFSSDHGVAPVPEEQAARHLPGGRLDGAALFASIDTALDAAFGAADWIRGTAGSSPYLDHALFLERDLDAARVRRVAAAAAEAFPNVARVYTREQLLSGRVAGEPASLRIGRSYHSQRSGDLEILLDPFWVRTRDATTHGTPYLYDSHVPLVFMGPGIRPGRHHRQAALNDVAPTLATLLRVELPSNAAGRVLDDILGGP